jgi:chaperonin cofactor prefoldin
MAFIYIEPDPPSGDINEYIYQELLRLADALNANLEEIDNRLETLEQTIQSLDQRITALGG